MRALLIGEARGINEDQHKHGFVGRSGQELARMGTEAKLLPELKIYCKNCSQFVQFGYCPCGQFNPVSSKRMIQFWSDCRKDGVGITNVFHEHPDRDNVQLFFGTRADDVCLDLPVYKAGSRNLYLLKKFRHYVDALDEEIRRLNPNVLIPLGNTACWAVLHQTAITKIRGTIGDSRFGIKFLATYHPAALRDWKLRPTIVSDLRKANLESNTRAITRPSCWILTSPTLDEIQDWFGITTPRYSCDIESGLALFSKTEITRIKKYVPRAFSILTSQISMVGFARSEDQGLVIPFLKRDEQTGRLENFWPDKWHTVRAWEWVQYGLSTGAELVFQNGMYDINRLLCHGMRPKNMKHDTMLNTHARFPEIPKGLGYLDSIYNNNSPWKTAYGSESLKRDD